MNKTRILRMLLLVLCGVLIAASAFTLIGCTDAKAPAETSFETNAEGEITPPVVKGEGKTVFHFHVVNIMGVVSRFEIHTDKTVVGEALQELGLIAGDPGPYGLYVKTVNGVTIDPDKGNAYWAFYEGDTYAAQGVDKTSVTPGATYAFKAERG